MGVIVELRNPNQTVEEKVKAYRHRKTRNRILAILTVFCMLFSTYLLLEVQPYNEMRTMQEYKNKGNDNNNYAKYSDGVVKYSRDGAAYLSKGGEERWNQSYQIKNPFVHTCEGALIIGDKGGNTIYVFGENGLRGEIYTNYPIESAVVASNGITSVLLRNGMTPFVICYDASGKVLIEHSGSLSGVGYPIGMALSPDGTMLQVSYLCVVDGVEATKIIYYDFAEGDTKKDSYQVAEEVYKNALIPISFFADDEKSILVSDSGFMIYEGKDQPKLTKSVEIEEEIQSVFYDEEYMGFILKNTSEEESEVRLYDMNGEQRMSKTFIGEYHNMEVIDGNVVMFDGGKCAIFSEWGVCKFEGEIEKDIKGILPLTGMNKYLLISNDGMTEIRLVK